MSELQVALIVLGVILIGVVLGLNWWQDRRVRRRMQEDFAPNPDDPLMDQDEEAPVAVRKAEPAVRKAVEPVLSEPSRREPGLGMARAEPVLGAVAAEDDRLVAETAMLEGDDPEEPDPACEAVIDLVFPHPVPAESLLPLVRDIHQAGQKSLRLFYRTSSGHHCARLRLGVSYVSMQLAVLLANRSGPLSPAEWSQAWARAQELADHFDAEVDGPDPHEITKRAKQLDAVCAALDTTVGLTLVARGPQPWRLTEVRARARDLGFSDSGDEHRMDWLNREGGVCFSLYVEPNARSRQPAATTRLSLLLDVPRSPASEHPFADMARVASQLAEPLEADVVDDNGQPLMEGSEAAVDKHLRGLYQRLYDYNLTAGSPRALRVFS